MLPLVNNTSVRAQSVDASVLVPDLLEHLSLASAVSNTTTPY